MHVRCQTPAVFHQRFQLFAAFCVVHVFWWHHLPPDLTKCLLYVLILFTQVIAPCTTNCPRQLREHRQYCAAVVLFLKCLGMGTVVVADIFLCYLVEAAGRKVSCENSVSSHQHQVKEVKLNIFWRYQAEHLISN